MAFGDNPLDPVYHAALDGDMLKALALLDAIPESALDTRQRASAQRLRERFETEAPASPHDLPPRTKAILGAYRRYWRSVMLRQCAAAEAEAALRSGLEQALAEAFADLDAASEAAKAAIEGEGLNALTGVTSPYYELMVWRVNDARTYRVGLPEQAIDVNVVFLDDFVALGWAAFATADHSHTGGWATATTLYAVRSAYDLESESFRVSYLAHEAQHFADCRTFPKLAQPELEYRAKLTELAQAQATAHDLVLRFAARTGSDRSLPHSLANGCLTRKLAAALADARSSDVDWRSIPVERINAQARSLLIDSTRELTARGASTVEQWLVP